MALVRHTFKRTAFDFDEAYKMISDIRLGINLGIIKRRLLKRSTSF